MFAKKFRLPSSITFSSKPFFVNEFCSIKIKKNDLGFNRYAFIVSKKVDKRATVRNRAKRVLRSYFEKLNPQISKSLDLLIIGKANLVGKTGNEVELSLEAFRSKIQ